MTDAMQIGTDRSGVEHRFRLDFDRLIAPRVLELGTLQSEQDRPTHHGEWLSPGSEFVRSDIGSGADVDVVADAHNLVDVFGAASFDAVIAVSVWEHLRFAWIAAQQVCHILRPGGLVYVATHHAFPVHGYSPDGEEGDFGRWTRSGLTSMFEWAGFETVETGYSYRCVISPPASVTRWNAAAPAWLNVDIYARRP